jgi:hypothetical protein
VSGPCQNVVHTRKPSDETHLLLFIAETVVPMYVCELAPTKIRGSLISFYNFWQVPIQDSIRASRSEFFELQVPTGELFPPHRVSVPQGKRHGERLEVAHLYPGKPV